MAIGTHVCSNCETRWARKVAVEKKAAGLQAAAAIWAAMVLLMTHFETTTARRCNSGSGSGNHGGSGGVEGGRSGSDGGGKDGWQRGGGTWQQEQRFGQCSGAAARISGRRRATAKMAAAMNCARCGGARRGQSAPSSLPQTQPQSCGSPPKDSRKIAPRTRFDEIVERSTRAIKKGQSKAPPLKNGTTPITAPGS